METHPRPDFGVCAAGVGHGPVGALVSAWPALALVGSFELLMMLIRTRRGTRAGEAAPEPRYQPVLPLAQEAPLEPLVAPTLAQTVRMRHEAGHSQRAIAGELNIAAKSNASSTKRHDSADRPGAQSARDCTPDLVRSYPSFRRGQRSAVATSRWARAKPLYSFAKTRSCRNESVALCAIIFSRGMSDDTRHCRRLSGRVVISRAAKRKGGAGTQLPLCGSSLRQQQQEAG